MMETTADVGGSLQRFAAPTLHDVAREAGVSPTTASRVLNGSTRKVAEPYRGRVEHAAFNLGYTANLAAQTTARGISVNVALLVADIADPYFALIAAGVARGADEAGLVVTIATTERDPAREVRLVRALRGQRPRGLILAASRDGTSSHDDLRREIAAIEASGGRVVALGPGANDVRSIELDNHGGARALAMALAARGYRRAIVLGGTEGLRTSDDRIAGFWEGLIAAGGEVARVYRGAFNRDEGERLMNLALADGVDRCTLVFAVNDVIAIGALTALRLAGRDKRDDIALAGFDDIPTSRDVTPALTTVRVPLEELGYQSLLAAIHGEWVPDTAALQLRVQLRESTPGL